MFNMLSGSAFNNKSMSEMKRYDIDALNDVFKQYNDIISKISDASTSLGQAMEKIMALDRAVQKGDSLGDLMLASRLRIKLVLSVVLPARQHMDRLVTRMKACAFVRDDVMSEVKRSKPAFE